MLKQACCQSDRLVAWTSDIINIFDLPVKSTFVLKMRPIGKHNRVYESFSAISLSTKYFDALFIFSWSDEWNEFYYEIQIFLYMSSVKF